MIARAVLLLLLLTPGCISQKDETDIDISSPVLQSGDFVKIDFMGKTAEDGEVFHTSYAEVAFDPDITKSKSFTFAEKYEPLSLTLGKGEVFPALEAGIVGMGIGETRIINLNPDEGYGERLPQRIVSLPRIATLPRLTEVSISDFKGVTGRDPELNETIPLNYWNVTIVNISQPNMTLSHEPENNTIATTEYGPALVTLNDTHVVTRLTPELDRVVVTSYGVGIIEDVNDTHFTLDYNHPLAGKTLTFEVKVRDIIKAKHIPGGEISWTDYETGISIAKDEKKPVLIEFYQEGCSACEAMDAVTFTNPEVMELKDRFVWIKVDVDKNPTVSEDYRVTAYPSIVLLDENGLLTEAIAGYITPYDLRAVIDALRLGEKV